MVISQLAAMELAESCERVERPFLQLFAWLRGARPQPARMLPVMPSGGIVPGVGEVPREERTVVGASADATVRS